MPVEESHTGAATAEVVVVTPVLLLVVLCIVQFGLWLHAEHVATAAARQGARAARVMGGSAAAGDAGARTLLDSLGAQVVRDAQVTSTRSATTARVEVRGVAPSVVPGLRLAVHAGAAGPVERFRAEAAP